MKTADGQTVNMSAKIYNGGGTFVIPIIQDYKTMSLRPMEINREITGLSKQNINVTIPFNLITQIGNAEVAGIEPTSSVLETDILTIVLYSYNAEAEGFEPPRRVTDLMVFKTILFTNLSILPYVLFTSEL